MENKINIAELLKDCPKGMELDCTMYEDVYFDYVDELNYIRCYIQQKLNKTSIAFIQDGTPNSHTKSKCVIFPKGKTTWEGFVPPCKFKDGDILFVKSAYNWICIYKESENDEDLYKYVATPNPPYHTYITYSDIPLCCKEDIYEIRLATEEEKQKLFQAIKDNGYHWNEETKTLEKLIKTKFKVGDRIRLKENHTYIYTITGIREKENKYECGVTFVLRFSDQDNYELVPNKFDITTLKPFESKVLVRDFKDEKWQPSYWGFYCKEFCYYPYKVVGGTYRFCIPYKGNEHLLGKTDDCDDFYKTW